MAIDAGEVQLRFAGNDVSLSSVLANITKNMSTTTANAAKMQATFQKANKLEKPYLAASTALAKLDLAAGRTTDAQQRLALALQNVNQQTASATRVKTQLQTILTKQARDTSQLALAESRLLRSKGDLIGAEKVLERALQKTNIDLKKQIQLEIELNRIKQRLSATAAQTATGFSKVDSVFAGFNRFIGAAFAIQGVAQGLGDFINAANQLEKVDITVKGLAGSTERYEEVLALARRQQKLFGGSMQETLEDMTGFIFTSRTTGVEVDKLVNAARRLAILDPVQGMQGAAIAIKELFSGEIRSLSQRFEIPRSTLQSINQLESGTAKMEAFERVLQRMGLSQELLEEQSRSTAVQWDRMTGSFEDAKAALGSIIANQKELAVFLTNTFSSIATGITALDNFSSGIEQISLKIVSGATSYDDYLARLEMTNKALRDSTAFGLMAEQIDGVSESFYNFAIQLATAQASAEEGFGELNFEDQQARISQLTAEIINTREELSELDYLLSNVTFSEDWIESTGNAVEEVNAFKTELYALAELSGTTGGRIEEIRRAVANNSITVAEGRERIAEYNAILDQQAAIADSATAAEEALANAELDHNAATESLATATNVLTSELAAQTYEETLAQAQSERLSIAQQGLYDTAMGAVNGSIALGDAVLIMGQKFNIAQSEAINLINTLRLLEAEKSRQAADQSLSDAGYTAAQQKAIRGLGFSNEVVQSIGDSRQALQDYNYEVADTAGKVDILNQRLGNLQYGSEEYYKTLLKLKGEEDKLAKEREKAAKGTGGGGGGGGGSSAASAAEKENEKLLKDKQKLYEDLEKAEEQYQEKRVDLEEKYSEEILDITKEFAEAQAEALAEQETGKRRSRYDFYKGLNPFEEGIDTSQFQAAYETAFAKAQEIAQSGRYQLSNEFLALRQDQIEELMDLQKEIAEIQTDEDLSESEKKKRIAYLEGLKKLLEDAQKQELDNLLAGGDENVQKYEEDLTDAQRKFAEESGKLADDYGKDVDKKLEKSEEFQTALEAENALIEKQRDLYNLLNQAQGIPSAAIPAIPAAAPILPTPTTGITQEPIPITIPEGTMMVHDTILNTTLTTVGSRLESKIDQLREAIILSNDTVTRAVNNVEIGIKRISSQTLTNR
jgi:hypothetical protein